MVANISRPMADPPRAVDEMRYRGKLAVEIGTAEVRDVHCFTLPCVMPSMK